eukprot:jgi/Tetstr1/425098/TSEL_015562.t1
MAASSTAQPPGVVKTLTDDKKRKRPVKKRRGKKLTVAESEAESEAQAEAEAEAEAEAARSSKRRITEAVVNIKIDEEPKSYAAYRELFEPLCGRVGPSRPVLTEISKHVYNLSDQFLPNEWIMVKREEGYYITAMAGFNIGSSMVVMSKGTPYTQRSYKVGDCFASISGDSGSLGSVRGRGRMELLEAPRDLLQRRLGSHLRRTPLAVVEMRAWRTR